MASLPLRPRAPRGGEAAKARYRQLHTAWNKRRRAYDAPAYARGFVLERTHAHVEGRPLESDALYLPPGERLIASERIDALREKEQGRLGRSNELLRRAGALEIPW